MSTLTNAIRANLAEKAAERWKGIDKKEFAEFLDGLLHDDKQTSRQMQLWPGGQTVYVRDLPDSKFEIGDKWDGPFREPTTEETRQVLIEEAAERYADREVYCCDSSLVSGLLQMGHGDRSEIGEAFDYENVRNIRVDPSEWDLGECKEWLDDKGIDFPDPNPFGKTHEQLREMIAAEDDEYAEANGWTQESLLKVVIEMISDGDVDGLDAWLETVSEHAEDEEIYEWWRVSDWLGEQLIAVGECVMDNGYGYWWGRGCTGQGYIMDGVLQKVAARHFR